MVIFRFRSIFLMLKDILCASHDRKLQTIFPKFLKFINALIDYAIIIKNDKVV